MNVNERSTHIIKNRFGCEQKEKKQKTRETAVVGTYRKKKYCESFAEVGVTQIPMQLLFKLTHQPLLP